MRAASIVISSYNYGSYLTACIESALAQTYPHVEVIVVDDGSIDGSREIIRQYSGRVMPILKDNGGQASSLNVGYHASHGDVILFMDSDDLLDPSAVATAMWLLAPGVVKAHWPLWVIDDTGKPTGRILPRDPLAAGDLREQMLTRSPASYRWPPTTGNAWSRELLDRIFPIPEREFRVCPDYYLSVLAPLYGPIAANRGPLGCWRVHGRNASFSESTEGTITRNYRLAEFALQIAEEHCARIGLKSDPTSWRADSHEHRLYYAMRDIMAVVPEGRAFGLADDTQFGDKGELGGRQVVPFPRRNGQHWGHPADDETAIQEVVRLRHLGVAVLVIAWPCFWYLTWYTRFATVLAADYPCALRNDRMIVYRLDA